MLRGAKQFGASTSRAVSASYSSIAFGRSRDTYHELQDLITTKSRGNAPDSPAKIDALIQSDPELKALYDKFLYQATEEADEAAAAPSEPTRPPVKVAVTGAAGAIGYATLFRIAAGELLGPYQPIELQLLEIPQGMKAVEGVVMELQDCAFPLLSSVSASADPLEAFNGADYAFLIGAQARTKGMQRSDLLSANAEIFKVQGAALNKVANRDTLRTVVVGNPANTNAWIAHQNAPDLSPTQFSAMTRLDHTRGLAQLSLKSGVPVYQMERFAIWGNHSSTQVPDVSNLLFNKVRALDSLDKKWLEKTFVPTVQERGAAIIAARGASSAASAANAAIQHMSDWARGSNGQWVSMGVWSDGSYGAEEGIYYSYPVVCSNGNYTIVQNVPINKATAAKMQASNEELISERDTVAKSLGIKSRSISAKYKEWKQTFEKDGKLPYFYPPSVPKSK